MAGRFLSVKRWVPTAVLLLLWLRLCAGSHKVGFQISRKIVKKLKNSIFLWVLFIFTVQRQGLWRGLCSVCVQARTKSVFISYARVRKSWKILFSYECCTSLLSNGEARGEGFALDATRSICFFSSIFYIFSESFYIFSWIFFIFSLLFHIFSFDFLNILIDFLNIFIDFLNSSILSLTAPQGPSKFPKILAQLP